MSAGASQRGAALFVVLLFSAFLAGLAAAAMRMSLSGVRAAAVFADMARADALGEGAADILASHMADGDDGTRRGGSIEVRLPDADIHVDYVSESARVDVNLASLSLIAGLLGAAGADADEVSAIVGRIALFRSAADAKATRPAPAPATAPAEVAPAASPAGAAPLPLAIHDVGEVGGDWGLPDDLARRILPALTVANGAATVDPILADRLVVAALLGSDERVDDYLNRRQQGFVDIGSALALLPVPMQNSVAFKDSEAVRAVARVSVKHHLERRYEMVLAPPKGTASQAAAHAVPVVVSWRKLL